MRWLRRWLYAHLFRSLVVEDILIGMSLVRSEPRMLYVVHLAARTAADIVAHEAATRPVAKPN